MPPAAPGPEGEGHDGSRQAEVVAGLPSTEKRDKATGVAGQWLDKALGSSQPATTKGRGQGKTTIFTNAVLPSTAKQGDKDQANVAKGIITEHKGQHYTASSHQEDNGDAHPLEAVRAYSDECPPATMAQKLNTLF